MALVNGAQLCVRHFYNRTRNKTIKTGVKKMSHHRKSKEQGGGGVAKEGKRGKV